MTGRWLILKSKEDGYLSITPIRLYLAGCHNILQIRAHRPVDRAIFLNTGSIKAIII